MSKEELPFHVGDRFERTHRFSVEEVRAFATAAGDTNPLHHDEDVAASSRYGRLIVSGTHTTALLLGLTASHFAGIGSVVGVRFAVEFRQAVGAEEAVTLSWTIDAIRPASSGAAYLVEMSGSVTGQQGQLCVAGSGAVLVTPSRAGHNHQRT